MTRTVLLVGNGLSIGYDPGFAVDALTQRVRARLDASGNGSVLDEIAQLGAPEVPEDDLDEPRRNFERLAGPVDRLATAVVAIEPLLASNAAIVGALRTASNTLREHYLRIVAATLLEVDALCRAPSQGNRLLEERRLDAFADALIEHHRTRRRIAVFTLNYDSVLMRKMLERAQNVYDGFPYGSLELPLDCWPTNPALYALHGTLTWVRQGYDVVKLTTDAVRSTGLLQLWANGDSSRGLPAVVLGDTKTAATMASPFQWFYQQFHEELASAPVVAAVGYGFYDRPVNRALARYLCASAQHRLQVWSRSATAQQAMVLRRLRCELAASERPIDTVQIVPTDVTLPDPAPVVALP